MAEFKNAVTTAQGVALIAKVLSGRCNINFTKIATGDGSYATDEDISRRTALKAERQTFPISAKEIFNQSTVHLKYIVSNVNEDGSPLVNGYYVKEVGLFANDPDDGEILYAMALAVENKWDHLPAYNGILPSTITMDWYAEVANAADVTIMVKPGAYVLQEDFNKLEERVTQAERASAACIGIRRKCQADGTPQSSTKWERWGQYTDAVVQFARGNESVQNDLMSKWPYNQLRPCNLPLNAEDPVAYLGDADFDWYGKTGVAAGTSVMLEIPTDMYIARWFEQDSSGQNWEYKCVADSDRYPHSTYVKDLMARADGSTRKCFYYPIFPASFNNSTGLVSVAGAKPATNNAFSTMRAAAKKNGANWQAMDIWAHMIILELAEIMSADSNFRETYGAGFSNAHILSNATALNDSENTNTIVLSNKTEEFLRENMVVNIGDVAWQVSRCSSRKIEKIEKSDSYEDAIEVTLAGDPFKLVKGDMLWRFGQITGSTIEMESPNGSAGSNDGLHSNRILYIEDLFGTFFMEVDGLNLKFNEDKMGLEMYVCQDPSKYGDTYDGFKLLPEVMSLYSGVSNNERSGYINKEFCFSEFPLLELPKEVTDSAGSSTYFASMTWKDKNGRRPAFGGSFNASIDKASPRFINAKRAFSELSYTTSTRPLRR